MQHNSKQIIEMNHQVLEEKVNETDPDFVSEIASAQDVQGLHKMKCLQIDPDKRELVQARIDFLYRKSHG